MTEMKQYHIFLPTFTIWFGMQILSYTTLDYVVGISISQLNTLIDWFVFALLAFQIVFLQKYTWKELIAIGVIAAIVVVSALKSSDFSMLSLLFFILAAKKIDFDTILRRAYHILLVMIPLVILLCIVGLIEDSVMYRSRSIRHSMGFAHPNNLGQFVFELVACHLYLNRDKLKARDIFISVAAIVFTYIVPNSQTAYISLMVLVLALMTYRFCERFENSGRKIFSAVLIASAMLFNFLSAFWSLFGVKAGTIVATINDFLSNRFSACNRIYQLYGVHWFGANFSYGMGTETDKTVRIWERLYLDNGYMSLLLIFGIFVYIIFSLALLYSMINCVSRSKYILLVFLFTVSLYGVMEQGFRRLVFNVFFLCFSELLYRHTDTLLSKRNYIQGIGKESESRCITKSVLK